MSILSIYHSLFMKQLLVATLVCLSTIVAGQTSNFPFNQKVFSRDHRSSCPKTQSIIKHDGTFTVRPYNDTILVINTIYRKGYDNAIYLYPYWKDLKVVHNGPEKRYMLPCHMHLKDTHNQVEGIYTVSVVDGRIVWVSITSPECAEEFAYIKGSNAPIDQKNITRK